MVDKDDFLIRTEHDIAKNEAVTKYGLKYKILFWRYN